MTCQIWFAIGAIMAAMGPVIMVIAHAECMR